MSEARCATCDIGLNRSIYVLGDPECFACQMFRPADETLIEQEDRLNPEAMAEARRRSGMAPRAVPRRRALR